MKWWAGLVSLVLILSSCSNDGIKKESRLSAHRISPMDNTGHCSGTAVGPHALLTAEHCDDGGDSIRVDGVPAHIDNRIKDGSDHLIYLLGGFRFDNWSQVVTFEFNVPQDVYMWGNPSRFNSLYRQGTISDMLSYQGSVFVVVDINVFFGDSGAALFNSDGQIILVFNDVLQDWHPIPGSTAGVSLKMAACRPLTFSQDQLMEAANYGYSRPSPYQIKH